jgi:hypothetical protein
MDPAQISALKDVHIYTVDQLAQLPDSHGKSVGPNFQELKQAAQRFLKLAQGSVDLNRVDDLENRIAELEAENEELRKNQKKKPGPKPKREAA